MPLMTMDIGGTLITGRQTGIGHVTDKLYDHLQIRAWKVQVTEAGANLSDPASDTPVNGSRHTKRELLAQEFGTTGALIEFDGTTMIFIGDSHALDSNVIARRADRCMGGTGALVNFINDGYSSGSGTGQTNPTGTVTTAKVAVTGLTSLFGV